MITYFKSQKDLSEALITIIDDYWALNIEEDDFIQYIKQIFNNNKDKIINNNSLTAIVRQRLGKKRIMLLSKILDAEIFWKGSGW